mgnify:CR=1 FL=1
MSINRTLDIKSDIADEKIAVINLLYTSNLLFDDMNSITKKFGVSIQQFNVLRILNGAEDSPVNMNYIQERMIHKMSNTSRIIDKLVDKELANRKVCDNNRRKIEIKIGDKGVLLLNKISNLIDEKEKSVCSHLNSEELKQLNQILDKLRTNE